VRFQAYASISVFFWVIIYILLQYVQARVFISRIGYFLSVVLQILHVCVCVSISFLFKFQFGNRFDVDEHVTGFGNPDWLRTHPAATSTAPSVSAVLSQGATCVGKTVMDEMAYRLVLRK
jgi:hypothetical protein